MKILNGRTPLTLMNLCSPDKEGNPLCQKTTKAPTLLVRLYKRILHRLLHLRFRASEF